MTDDSDRIGMNKAVKNLDEPKAYRAKSRLLLVGHYNKGIQKALDKFYARIESKRGNQVAYNSRGQVVARDKLGQYRSRARLQTLIKRLEQQTEESK